MTATMTTVTATMTAMVTSTSPSTSTETTPTETSITPEQSIVHYSFLAAIAALYLGLSLTDRQTDGLTQGGAI